MTEMTASHEDDLFQARRDLRNEIDEHKKTRKQFDVMVETLRDFRVKLAEDKAVFMEGLLETIFRGPVMRRVFSSSTEVAVPVGGYKQPVTNTGTEETKTD